MARLLTLIRPAARVLGVRSLALGVLLVASAASAQTTDDRVAFFQGEAGDQTLTVTWTAVTINREDCEDGVDERPVTFVARIDAGAGVAPNSKLFIWHDNDNVCTFDTEPDAGDLLVEETLSAGDPFVAGTGA